MCESISSPQEIAHFYLTRELGADWQEKLVDNLMKVLVKEWALPLRSFKTTASMKSGFIGRAYKVQGAIISHAHDEKKYQLLVVFHHQKIL